MKKTNILKRKIEAQDWIRIAALLLFIGLVACAAVFYVRTLGQLSAKDPAASFLENTKASGTAMKDYLSVTYPHIGFLVMMFLQMLHVVVSAVPAAIISFASGMIYGLPWGMAINIAGTTAGTAISFYLSRLLGRRVLTLFVSEKNIARMEKLIDGNTSAIVLLILFIIPSPKDFFSYFIGLTHMKASKYFLISAVGRLPGMLVTAYLGAHILDAKPNWALLIGCTAFACVVSAIVVIFNEKLMKLLKRKKAQTREENREEESTEALCEEHS